MKVKLEISDFRFVYLVQKYKAVENGINQLWPYLKAKRAITQLTKENCELDVRIAVIEHEITQKVLKMATAH